MADDALLDIMQAAVDLGLSGELLPEDDPRRLLLEQTYRRRAAAAKPAVVTIPEPSGSSGSLAASAAQAAPSSWPSEIERAYLAYQAQNGNAAYVEPGVPVSRHRALQ